MAFEVFLSAPHLFSKEFEFVKEAFDTNWIAPYGPQLTAFEQEMSKFCGVESALACVSGTAALHLALRWFGVGPEDVVFCSDFTFSGSCNPIMYQHATPVFIDSEPNTWNMSPAALERALASYADKGKLPKAVIIVDLYGESADWDRLLPICRKYNVPVIEDAAEAVGSTYKGRKCGSFGDVGIYSFNGNKIITTSGGGMVLSENEEAIAKMRYWSTQAREPVIWYEHTEYGYNYRMSNVCAAIGRGQLLSIEEKVRIRTAIHDSYTKELIGLPLRIKQNNRPGSNYWLSMMVLESDNVTPLDVLVQLQNAGIEARPAWKPMHMQPVFASYDAFAHEEGQKFVGRQVFETALCLPSGDGMTQEQFQRVVTALRHCF